MLEFIGLRSCWEVAALYIRWQVSYLRSAILWSTSIWTAQLQMSASTAACVTTKTIIIEDDPPTCHVSNSSPFWNAHTCLNALTHTSNSLFFGTVAPSHAQEFISDAQEHMCYLPNGINCARRDLVLAGIHFSDLLVYVNRRRHFCGKQVSLLKKATGAKNDLGSDDAPDCKDNVFDRCHA